MRPVCSSGLVSVCNLDARPSTPQSMSTSPSFQCRSNQNIWPRVSCYGNNPRSPKVVPELASFKLSYVSPENHKIGKSGWWKLGRKSWVWRRKTGFENFSLDENECFEVDLQFGKVNTNQALSKNVRKWPKTISKNAYKKNEIYTIWQIVSKIADLYMVFMWFYIVFNFFLIFYYNYYYDYIGPAK